MKKLLLLAGAGILAYSFKDQIFGNSSSKSTITLSNLTDMNWENGVATSYNMLLVDNTPANQTALATGTSLQLSDGNVINYTGVQVAGDYIQVMLTANAYPYQAAQYPNQISVI